MFEIIGHPIIKDVLEGINIISRSFFQIFVGYNSTVIAYG